MRPVITRRTWVTGPLLLLAGLALGLVLAGPAVASEPGPAYPPGAGAEDVVQAEGGPGVDEGAAADESTDVGEPATEDRPDDAAAEADDEAAAEADEVAQDGAPEADESRIGPILIVIGTAVLLGGAVVAIARRI